MASASETTTDNNAGGKPPFMAFANDSADIEILKAFAASHQWAQADIHQGDIKTATEFLKSHKSPVLLMVEVPSAQEAPALLDALADVCDPDTKVMVIGSINEFSFYSWLTDIGIFSYLLKPLTLQTLESTYQKSTQSPTGQVRQGKQPARTIAVIGTRGGVGASTVCLNLAGMIASMTQKQVVIADIDTQLGTVALSLDIEPSRGLRDAFEKPDRIDSLFIDRVMSKPLKNLSVLSAEEALHERVEMNENTIPVLFKELRDKFDVIIVDVPRHLEQYARQSLKLSDHVVMVTELNLLSLRDALRLGDLMRESLKIPPAIVVSNRAGMVPKQEMQIADFEKGINAKVSHRIPYAPEVFMPIGTDIPVLKMKSHASVKIYQALAEQVLPELKQQAAEAAPKKAGLLGKKK